jgi:hypothetical protein
MALMFRALVFFGLVRSLFACATLDVLVNAAANYSATIQQQLEKLQSDPSPPEVAERTIGYAEAKTAYFKGLREEVLTRRIAMTKSRPCGKSVASPRQYAF